MIGTFSQVDLICERNFDNFFVVFEYSFFLFFRPDTSLKKIPKKRKPQAIAWHKSVTIYGQPWAVGLMSGFAISLLTGIEHGQHFDITHCSELVLLIDEAWREIRPFSECIEKTQN